MQISFVIGISCKRPFNGLLQIHPQQPLCVLNDINYIVINTYIFLVVYVVLV